MTTSPSTQPNQLLRADQARELRALVAMRNDSALVDSPDARRCHSIAISGGKGGVGRSVIALNLAIGLAQKGATVGLIDASQDLGSVELLCGLNSYWNLSHVVQGSRQVGDVLQTGPAGIRVLSGASCLVDTENTQPPVQTVLLSQLKSFEQELDWLIIDGSGGACGMTQKFALAADDLLVVTTPEPTAVAEAYSSIKALAKTAGPRLGLLVNQAESAQQAQQILDQLQQMAHSFLRIDLHRRGYLPHDRAVQTSVNGRTPFVVQSPQSSVTTALFELIQRWNRPQTMAFKKDEKAMTPLVVEKTTEVKPESEVKLGPKIPQFDFYTILPDKEVIVPEYEIKTRAREERVGKAKETHYIMQAGSFKTFKEAEQLRLKLATMGIESKIDKGKLGDVNWYRVKMGPYTQTDSVNTIRARLRQNGIDILITEQE